MICFLCAYFPWVERKHGGSSEEDEDSMDEDSASTASSSSKKGVQGDCVAKK